MPTKGVYYSSDDGQNWVNVDVSALDIISQFGKATDIHLTMGGGPSHPLYAALLGPVGTGTDQRTDLLSVLRSTDAAVASLSAVPHWAAVGAPPAINHVTANIEGLFAVAASPIDDNLVYIGGDRAGEGPGARL